MVASSSYHGRSSNGFAFFSIKPIVTNAIELSSKHIITPTTIVRAFGVIFQAVIVLL